MMQTETCALIWDYDGTLVNTSQKNLNVTRKIIRRISDKDPEQIPALENVRVYEATVSRVANWRELYTRIFGLSEQQTDAAGCLWTELQLSDPTPTPFYPGVDQVLQQLTDLPHGIVSQNAQSNITRVLQVYDLLRYFKRVIGYEEVDFHKQKPAPDGLLMCLEAIADGRPGTVFFIGDHQTDALCVHNARRTLQTLRPEIEVKSIAAFYGSGRSDREWSVKPDFKAYEPQEILEIVAEV